VAQDMWYEPYNEIEVLDKRRISGKTGGYPPYRYTPRFVSKTQTWRYLNRRLNGSNGYNVFEQYGVVVPSPITCTPQVSSAPCSGPSGAEWTDVTHANLSNPYNKHNVIPGSEITAAEQKLVDSISVEALCSYDLLTDVAEAREIPSMVIETSRELKSVFESLSRRFGKDVVRKASKFRPIDLVRHPYKVMNQIGEKWMMHRYGIMPLVYSYRSIQKALNKAQVVTSHKSTRLTPTPTGVTLPSASNNYTCTEITGDIRIRANVFQVYEWASGQQEVTGIGFNPLVTAWELIPYSFVADWFVNIGDYITRVTTPIQTQKYWACISRRVNLTKTTWNHYKADNLVVTYANVLPTNWWGSNPPATPSKTISRPEQSQLLVKEVENTYFRYLFSLNDAQFRIDVNLNWRRYIDSAVMANNQLKTYLFGLLRRGR